MSDTQAQLACALTSLFGPNAPEKLGVAVSGGSDSLALMHLLAQWAAPRGVRLFVATVDHGLRPGSADEAAGVAGAARALGLAHDTLLWQGWRGQGNLQDQARQARYGLLADWAKKQGLAAVALGHTLDDQAETVLMQLTRAAGVDGLAAMPARRARHGVDFVRPLLGIGRAALRQWLGARGHGWVDDPSNADPRFHRVQLRHAMPALAQLGLDGAGLARVAGHMAQARHALECFTSNAARAVLRPLAGNLVIDSTAFAALPPEIQRRLMARALAHIGQAPYGARAAAMQAMVQAVLAGQAGALQGCLLVRHRGRLHLCREYQQVAQLRAQPGQPWDGRWHFAPDPAAGAGQYIAAHGPDGLAQVAGWRRAGLPRAAALAVPALWQNDSVLASPLAENGPEWAEILAPAPDVFADPQDLG